MSDRVTKLKKKMEAKRRKRNSQAPNKQRQRMRGNGQPFWDVKHDEEREDTMYTYGSSQGIGSSKHEPEPFFRKDTLMMQLLASVCLFLVIAILLQTNTPALEGARNYVQTSFEEEFQFDRVATWYEESFGRPLALVPTQLETVAPGDMEEDILENYALPATGTVRETFEQNGRGIYVETDVDEPVGAVRSGVVTHIGEDEDNNRGKVVVVRHYDGGESWYGMLDDIHVSLYDHVDGGEIIAQVSSQEENSSVGIYYFALKEGDAFVDPIEVITVD